MSELKFKLKKDGKCVGFARFSSTGANGLQFEYWWNRDPKSKTAQWDWHHNFAYDSIYPFVCLDRHGKEVYEEDTVLIDGDEHSVEMRPMVRELMHEYSPVVEEDIELIEDQP